MNDQVIDFDDLVGLEFDFYGCDEQRFKLDDTVYEVVDGEVRLSDDRRGLHDLPIARVVVEDTALRRCNGYSLIDLHDEHCWLSFGIDYSDFTEYEFFEWTPKGADE